MPEKNEAYQKQQSRTQSEATVLGRGRREAELKLRLGQVKVLLDSYQGSAGYTCD